MQYDIVAEDAYIREELTFSEVDKLRRMALEATMGLVSLRHFGAKDEYLNEVRKGTEFCQEFIQGHSLAREKMLSSALDLPLWQGFQKIISRAKAKQVDLNEVADKISKLERMLSLIVEKKGHVDEKNLVESQRLLLDAVRILY